MRFTPSSGTEARNWGKTSPDFSRSEPDARDASADRRRYGRTMGLIGHPADDGVAAGVSTVTLADLAADPRHRMPRLLDRHLLVLVQVGHGQLELDFRALPCRPGTLVWARPGQVVRLGGQSGLEAIVVCWDPSAVSDAPDGVPFGDGYWQLAGEDEDAVINEVSQLVVDSQRHRSGTLAAELLRHQLTVLLLRIALLPGGSTDEDGAYSRFRRAVEDGYARTRRVEEYAERMGYSVRTITRACLAATGRSAKQVIDDRVTLEAKRLLAATDDPIADVGRRLGFPEPTNFGRFFHREVGVSPGAFRQRQRAAPSGPVAALRVPLARDLAPDTAAAWRRA
jgi:AraC-like DNA-binding protein